MLFLKNINKAKCLVFIWHITKKNKRNWELVERIMKTKMIWRDVRRLDVPILSLESRQQTNHSNYHQNPFSLHICISTFFFIHSMKYYNCNIYEWNSSTNCYIDEAFKILIKRLLSQHKSNILDLYYLVYIDAIFNIFPCARVLVDLWDRFHILWSNQSNINKLILENPRENK